MSDNTSFFFRFSVSIFRTYFDNTWSSFKQDDHGINVSYNVKSKDIKETILLKT